MSLTLIHKTAFLLSADMARLLLLSLLCIVLFAANLFLGPVNIPFEDVLNALFGAGHDSTYAYIIRETRFPKAVTALMGGVALAVSGLLLQTMFSNPLADASILGINSGSSLGVAVVMLCLGGAVTTSVFSLSGFLLILAAAFIGSVLVTGMLLVVSSFVRNPLMLLIVGIMTSYVTSSFISLLNFTSTAEGVHSYIIWGLGNFSGVPLSHLSAFSLVIIAALLGAITLIKPLDALLLGENYAANLGVSIRGVRFRLLAVVGVLTAVVTAYCGPIAFVGLAVPHMARLLTGRTTHRVLFPVTLLLGGAIALFCNVVCNLPGDSGIIPLNVVTPLFGVPVILYVLFHKQQLSA